MSNYKVKNKVWFVVAETSPLGGGRHKGVIDAIVSDIFDGTVLYIIKAVGGAVIPVREEAIAPYKSKK